jgi:hypothetical protein
MVALVVLSMIGCIERSRTLPREYVEQHGARTFAASYDDTFLACVTALQAGQFAIAVDRSDLGVLDTRVRVTEVSGHVVQNTVTVSSSGHAWSLRIEPAGQGTRVIAYPRRFVNGVEYDKFFRSDVEVEWRDLFRAIETYLPRREVANTR